MASPGLYSERHIGHGPVIGRWRFTWDPKRNLGNDSMVGRSRPRVSVVGAAVAVVVVVVVVLLLPLLE